MAAWSARKLGGLRMTDALIASADRRSGRDPYTLFYLAVLTEADALPVIARHRVPRMLYLKWTRASELEYLDYISRQLNAGRRTGDARVLTVAAGGTGSVPPLRTPPVGGRMAQRPRSTLWRC